MEEIFYAALALHIAGKPANKENIQAVLSKAGTPVDEPALDAIAAFVESLAAAGQEKDSTIDPRIIKFLTTELTGQKVETKQLEVLLAELSKAAALVPETQNAIFGGLIASEEGEAKHKARGSMAGDGFITKEAKAVARVMASKPEVSARGEGRYVYGVAVGEKEIRLGTIGIEGSEVYTIPYEDISAIVHNCSTEPYQSTDDETVKNWVKIHQSVLDTAGERLGIVIPLGFDTILLPKDDVTSPEQVVKDWLKKDYDRLREVMRNIEGKDEYGVQVSYEPKLIIMQISEKSEEIRKIKEEIATKSPGMAYMYKQKLERAVKAETEKLANVWFTDFYGRIKKYTDDIIVEKTKKLNNGKVMLLNLSCLVARERIESLGKELEEINNMDGFFVHFSGPWPPYSFVAKPVVLVKGE
ncbi:MAG: GvpL/GvpF family gas vesicle protein [Dehalococcoidia bacterium]